MQKGQDGEPSLPLQTVNDHVSDEFEKRTLGVLKHKGKGPVSREGGRIGLVRGRAFVHGASVHLDGDRHETVEVDNILEAVTGDVVVEGFELESDVRMPSLKLVGDDNRILTRLQNMSSLATRDSPSELAMILIKAMPVSYLL
jgi:hypothetical protein